MKKIIDRIAFNIGAWQTTIKWFVKVRCKLIKENKNVS
jgi:hypothetical protein